MSGAEDIQVSQWKEVKTQEQWLFAKRSFFRFLSEERRPVGSKRLKSVKLAMILAVIRGGSSPRFSEKAAFAEGKKKLQIMENNIGWCW